MLLLVSLSRVAWTALYANWGGAIRQSLLPNATPNFTERVILNCQILIVGCDRVVVLIVVCMGITVSLRVR